MKNIICSIILALTFIGAAQSDEAEKVVGHPPRLGASEKIVPSYDLLEEMLQAVTANAGMTLYEGLPHQTWDREQLEQELKNKKTVQRYGFPFYENPNPVSKADEKKLRAIVKDPASFSRFRGFKACGGFHPDFALVWSGEGEPLEIHLCFGCGEIRAYRGKREVYCEMDGEEKFKEILMNYKKQRPDPKRH